LNQYYKILHFLVQRTKADELNVTSTGGSFNLGVKRTVRLQIEIYIQHSIYVELEVAISAVVKAN